MFRILLTTSLLLLCLCVFAQEPPLNSFSGFIGEVPEKHDNIPADQWTEIKSKIQTNITSLERRGISARSTLQRPMAPVKFAFPLRQASGFNDPSFYGISNFIDQNPTGESRDFNCGSRTYKNHKGTDFFTAPFWWQKMDDNAVEIIAAADGIIVDKGDGQNDRNCKNCEEGAPQSCYYWNAVYVQHADGTIAFYGHMKKNSLTTKNVGSRVSKGEYLGVVGSSGNSSGPHLHFELWKDENFSELLDPWGGACNTLSNESLWEDQEPYYNHKILKIISSPADVARWKECYDGSPETDNSTNSFTLGETVFLTVFARDNINGGPGYKMKLINPAGVVKYDWTLNAYSSFYPWLYFSYSFNAVSIDMAGTWKFQLTYDQDYTEHEFTVNSVLPLRLKSFTAQKMTEYVRLNWLTENEVNTSHFEVEKSSDSRSFKSIAIINTEKEKTGSNNYSYTDADPQEGVQYYRLKMVDRDGGYSFSEVVKVDFGQVIPVQIFPNPAMHFVDIKNVAGYDRLSISNMNGQTVVSKKISGNQDRVDISHLTPGVYVVLLSGDGNQQKLKLVKK